MIRIIILAAFFLSFSAPLIAQFRLGLNFDWYKPQNQFSENVSNTPVGFALTGLQTLNNDRFSVGGEIGVAMYANRTYDYELIEEGSAGEVVEIDEEDCFLHVNALARYQIYRTNTVEAYAEIRSGIYTFFSTRIATERTELYDDQTEFHGTSFNTGLGGGLSINMTNLFGGKSYHPIFLEFASTYNTGTRATYRNMGNETGMISGSDTGKYRSMVNYMNFKLGVSVQL